jgi:hypothetical protein
MTLSVGSIASNNPVDSLSTAIKNLCGTAGLANWSFVENIPAGACIDEWQTLTLTDWGAGDSFKLTYNAVETGAINYASDISSAIANALNAIAPFSTWGKEITCTRINVNNYIIKFSGSRITGTNMEALTCTSAVGCSGNIVVTQEAVPKSNSDSFSVDIFKCAGTGDDANDAGVDWYLAILKYGEFPASSWNACLITIAEEYNSTTKRLAKFINLRAGSSSSTFCSADANGYGYSSDVTYHLNAANAVVMADLRSGGTWSVMTLNSTGFRYWITMTNNFIMVSTRVGTSQYHGYYGLMDSIVDASLNDTLPLVMICNNSTNVGVNGAFIKVPGVTSVAGRAFSFDARPHAWNSVCTSSLTGTAVVEGNYDIWKDQKIDVSRVMVWQNVTSSQFVNWGCIRGLLKSGIMCITTGGSVSLGDTITIGEDTWTVVGLNAANYIHLITKG